jgi:hypothetical protein
VRDRATATPLKGLLHQNSDESNYGVPLQSGDYRKIVTTAEHLTCVYVRPQGLDAVGNTIYTSRVTGVFVKKAPRARNRALNDLETAYSVLAYQLRQYVAKLGVCIRTHAGLACSKLFATRAEHEFALFERRLQTDNLPVRVRSQVGRVDATARSLTKLFEGLTTEPPTVAAALDIRAGISTLDRQFQALVRALS